MEKMDWLKHNNIYGYTMGEEMILYSPLGRCYLLTNKKQMEEFFQNGTYSDQFLKLTDYIPLTSQNKVREPRDYSLLTILPNNKCNFACSYCYSANARNGAGLEVDKLKKVIDYFVDSKPDGYKKKLSVSFMGGGEPMLSWDCVKQGILYAKQKVAAQRLNLRIITNGSILSDEWIAFIKSNAVEISVSFEIIPEIQNMQRKHYQLVHDNIKRMVESGISVQINSTITPANVNCLEEMVCRLNKEFPAIKNVMFEPVVSEAMFQSPLSMRVFYNDYIKNFCASLELADQFGISLTSFAYLRTIFPLERACPGEFCVTADGDITGCYCVATENDSFFKWTKYGTVDDAGIHFDMENYSCLMNQNVYTKTECQDCEVKWNCGGGCFHQYNSYSIAYREEVCRFTKLFVENIVKYKSKKFLRKQYAEERPTLPVFFKEI